jgi:hypothetical protein
MFNDRKLEGRMDLLAKELHHLLAARPYLHNKENSTPGSGSKGLHSASNPAPGEFRHLMVIDIQIQDYQTICYAIQDDVQLLLLDGEKEGLPELLARMSTLHHLHSISIVSPGISSEVCIGKDRLLSKNLARHAPDLRKLASYLMVQGVLVFFGMRSGQEHLENELLLGLHQIMACQIMTSAES